MAHKLFRHWLCCALLLASVILVTPASAQQEGDSDEDRTHQYLLSPTRPLAECAARTVFEAYKRYGLAGTVGVVPTDLLDAIAVGLPATIAHCNRMLGPCFKAAQAFYSDIRIQGDECEKLGG